MNVNFLRVHWKITIKETQEVIECSDKDLDKQAPSNNDFKPFEIVIGKEKLFKKLEEEISKNIKSKEYFNVELSSEEAYGKKNAKMIETIPLREFTKQKINPYPGAVLDFGGISGRVLFIGSGRVTVDFNHPLASKSLIYDVKVVEEIKEPIEKVDVLVAPYKGAIKDLKYNLVENKLVFESKIDLKESFKDLDAEIKELVKEVKEIEYIKTEAKKIPKTTKKVTVKKSSTEESVSKKPATENSIESKDEEVKTKE